MKRPVSKKNILALVLIMVITALTLQQPVLAGNSPVSVAFRNPNIGQTLSQLDPWYKITAVSNIDLSKLKIRYYYCINGERPQSYAIDYASIDSSTITGSFAKISPAHKQADYWFEIGFKSGSMSAGQSAEINSRIFKNDGSHYNQYLNYSFAGPAALSNHIAWNYITVYYDGVLVQGIPLEGEGIPIDEIDPTPDPPTEPSVPGGETPVQNGSISLQMKNGSPNHPNTIYAWYKLFNNTEEAIALSRVTLRYYFTSDGNSNQILECDNFRDEKGDNHGNSNVFGTFSSIQPQNGIDTYYEMGFSAEAGSISSGGFVQVDTRAHDVSWKNYNQQNDYSYHSQTDFINWVYVDVFIDGILVWGNGVGTNPTTPPTPTPTPLPEPEPIPVANDIPTVSNIGGIIEIEKGQTTALSGTIESQNTINAVRFAINGSIIQNFTPNEKHFDLSQFSAWDKLNTKAGAYKLEVYVETDSFLKQYPRANILIYVKDSSAEVSEPVITVKEQNNTMRISWNHQDNALYNVVTVTVDNNGKYTAYAYGMSVFSKDYIEIAKPLEGEYSINVTAVGSSNRAPSDAEYSVTVRN